MLYAFESQCSKFNILKFLKTEIQQRKTYVQF
jgi:hypothetical protein